MNSYNHLNERLTEFELSEKVYNQSNMHKGIW